MIKTICRDQLFLQLPSREATIEDKPMAQDLLDTLEAHRQECVGMAANMIGEAVKILCFTDIEGVNKVMFNPMLLKVEKPYAAEEGCLSLSGVRKTKRYRKIKVQYMDFEWRIRIHTYEGFVAQIIQHEMDHFEGIII